MGIYFLFVKLTNRFLSHFGFALISAQSFSRLRGKEIPLASQVLGLMRVFPAQQDLLLRMSPHSKSQLGQDLFALAVLGGKESGFFVEFGAGDGVHLSNTYLLEKEFGWTGVLAEPNPEFFAMATENRSCSLDPRAIIENGGAPTAFVPDGLYGSTALSYSVEREFDETESAQEILVDTVSLQNLLEEWNAPARIDFLSIDVEGGELACLRSVDHSNFRFTCLVIEHNFRLDREEIAEFLRAQGYVQICAEISQFDDWWFDGQFSTV